MGVQIKIKGGPYQLIARLVRVLLGTPKATSTPVIALTSYPINITDTRYEST